MGPKVSPVVQSSPVNRDCPTKTLKHRKEPYDTLFSTYYKRGMYGNRQTHRQNNHCNPSGASVLRISDHQDLLLKVNG